MRVDRLLGLAHRQLGISRAAVARRRGGLASSLPLETISLLIAKRRKPVFIITSLRNSFRVSVIKLVSLPFICQTRHQDGRRGPAGDGDEHSRPSTISARTSLASSFDFSQSSSPLPFFSLIFFFAIHTRAPHAHCSMQRRGTRTSRLRKRQHLASTPRVSNGSSFIRYLLFMIISRLTLFMDTLLDVYASVSLC